MLRPWTVETDGSVRIGDRGRLLLYLRIAGNPFEREFYSAEEQREADMAAAEWRMLPNKPEIG